MTPMINDELKFQHPLHLLVMLVHVQLHQLLLCENIIVFLDKLSQLHVHGVWRIILFTLEILNLHPICTNAPILQF
jgi:hypothetical protein